MSSSLSEAPIPESWDEALLVVKESNIDYPVKFSVNTYNGHSGIAQAHI